MEDFDIPEFGDIGLGDLDLDLDAFGEPGTEIETRYIKPPLYVGKRRSPVMYDRAVELVRDVGPAILEGERVDAILSGNFIFGDLFEALLVEADELCEDLTLSTLSLGVENVESFHNLIAGDYVQELNIVVSDYWYSHHRPDLPFIYERLDIRDAFQLAVAGVHTKIAMMRIGERRLTFHGSANLRSSRSVEHVTIESDPAIYEFHRAWHQTILDHYGTIQKSVRASALFDLLTRNQR